jgi:hypothetical protein
MTTISIDVDTVAAQNYFDASAEEKRKLQLLLNLRLRELTIYRAKPLPEIMNEIGSYAEAHGLTREIFESLLLER